MEYKRIKIRVRCGHRVGVVLNPATGLITCHVIECRAPACDCMRLGAPRFA